MVAPSAAAATGLEHLSRQPYLGVACPVPNSIRCDRVGLAIWLNAPADKVVATVNGQPVRLRPAGGRRRARTYWEGYLQPAGLLRGPLRVTPDRGRYRWQGIHPRDARVAIDIRRPDGSTAGVTQRLPLRAGWG